MSGFLGNAIGVLDAVSAVSTLANYAPAVTLDSFGFHAWEVPERIRWGGDQTTVVHKLPNNPRVVDLLGNEDEPITWDGVFLGADAKDRVRALKAMEEAGGPYDLAWRGSLERIASFKLLVDEGYQQIRYSITCVVLPVAADDGEAPPDTLASLNTDAGVLGGIPLASTPALSGAVGSVSSGLANVAGLVPGGLGVAALSSSLAQASSVAQAAIGAADAAMQGYAGLPGLLLAQQFPAVSAAAGQLAGASLAGAYLGRMARQAAGVA